MGASGWQERYDRSISEHEAALEQARASRSTWEKVLDRSAVTGSLIDLVILPFVALGHGVAALIKRRRGRPRATGPIRTPRR